jgi:hypothetical protein
MAPWHLTLGALDELHPSIELDADQRLALHFESSAEWPELPHLRVAMVQPGRQIELHPLHPTARSLPLPRPMAPLHDLWLLVRTATRRYWFEAPYGVCGSPELHVDAPQAGPPRPPPGVMVEDAVLPWRAIRFSLGPVGDCQLELLATSARPGELELEARRDAPGPPPEVALAAPGGGLELREPWRASGAEPGQLQVARYAFVPGAGAPAVRAFVRITVGDEPGVELTLPTSLTDPAHRSAARHRIGRGA